MNKSIVLAHGENIHDLDWKPRDLLLVEGEFSSSRSPVPLLLRALSLVQGRQSGNLNLQFYQDRKFKKFSIAFEGSTVAGLKQPIEGARGLIHPNVFLYSREILDCAPYTPARILAGEEAIKGYFASGNPTLSDMAYYGAWIKQGRLLTDFGSIGRFAKRFGLEGFFSAVRSSSLFG